MSEDMKAHGWAGLIINPFTMEIIKKVAWILIQDNQILSTLSKGKDVYYIPGGKKEVGESNEETLIREIKEELSVEIVPDSIQYLETFLNQAHGKPAGVLVEMICYVSDYRGELKADSEIEKFIWLTYEDRSQVAPVDQLIFDWLRSKHLF